ncbi:MAG TPA: 2'-5' RNA ligase family protein [Bacteroidales bacterium]|nr:2'-5' RNA ligase family protein [Bacteroidales bacterium]HPS15911.1 2'-5' RNA ligase family protein [Bacteroidales bacterium]
MNSLYFIAITPDDVVSKEVVALKNHMASTYSSKAALTSPPHITLYPPFKMDSIKENELINTLTDFVKGKVLFSFNLKSFGCFKPRVIFINPEPSKELNLLHQKLIIHLKEKINLYDSQNERPYHPHMTIATRDLQKEYFFKAWDEFQNKKFNATFNVDSIVLLKHNGKNWLIYKIFRLL